MPSGWIIPAMTAGRNGLQMIELTLSHRELKELINLVEELNPPGTLLLQAGRVKITVENHEIGNIVTATVPIAQGERWGEWTTRITDESHW